MPLSTPSASEAAIAGAAAVAAATTQKLTPQEELDRLQASISGRTQDVDTQQLQTQQLGVDAPRTIETARSEEHTSELQSRMCISYAVFCLTIKKQRSDI